MPLDYLHHHQDYKDLIRTVAEEKGISPDLVEKDYLCRKAANDSDQI